MKNRRASSLIFVMLLVAGVVTVALGTQRLALVQFSQSVADEDNLSAYYAAKAGIEDGLARFRFNRNADTVQTANGQTGLTAERYDLSAGQGVGYIQDNSPITTASGYNPAHQYYDLKVNYRAPSLSGLAITQDDNLELTGFPDSNNPYYLYFKLTWPTGSTGCFVTFQEVSQTANGNQFQPIVTANQSGTNLVYDSAGQGTNLYIRTSAGGASLANSVRIRPFGCNVTADFKTVTGTSGTTNANIDFDSTKTSITATGYFGTTKRTLLATVDRHSGTLISIYDFNVYAGTGDVTP